MQEISPPLHDLQEQRVRRFASCIASVNTAEEFLAKCIDPGDPSGDRVAPVAPIPHRPRSAEAVLSLA